MGCHADKPGTVHALEPLKYHSRVSVSSQSLALKASTSELTVYSQEGSGTLLGHGPAGQPPSREESKSVLYSQRFVFDQKRN